jgi:hypothetical protein
VLKRGWHEERELGSVAWLCRACHSFVHRVCSNEELARHWYVVLEGVEETTANSMIRYTVELLEDREDVQKWIGWVGKVRWKAR